MSLKSLSPKVEVLEIEGSEIHAVRPTKSMWDEYIGAMFERDKKGEIVVKSHKALVFLYKACIRKITNVDVELETGIQHKDAITDPEEIVKFMAGLNNLDAGRRIDEWLLSLGELSREEAKN